MMRNYYELIIEGDTFTSLIEKEKNNELTNAKIIGYLDSKHSTTVCAISCHTASDRSSATTRPDTSAA